MAEAIVQDSGQQTDTTKNQEVSQDANVQQGQQVATEQSSQPVQEQQETDTFVEIVPSFTQPQDRPAAVVLSVVVRVPGKPGYTLDVANYTQPPKFGTAYKDLVNKIVASNNSNKRTYGHGVRYSQEELEANLNSAIAEINRTYKKPEPKEYRKEKEKQEHEKQEQQNKQENEATECPECHQQTWTKITVDGKTGWQCSKCGHHEEYRLEYPYEFTMQGGLLCKMELVEFQDEDGKKTKNMVPKPVGDFGIVPLQQIQVNDKVYYKYKITHREKKMVDGEEKVIDKETIFTLDNDTFSDSRKFHAALTHACPDINFNYYLDTKIRQAFREIKSQAGNIEKIKKTSNFGWNDDFTGYLTDKLDIKLAGQYENDNGIEYFRPADQNRGDGTYEVIDSSRGLEEGEEAEGSVMLDQHDPDLARVHVTFNSIGSSENLTKILLHYKSDLLTLHPIMPRVIGITFAAPLASMLEDLAFYLMYILGKTGYGKTAIEILMASHFGKYNGAVDFINPLDSPPIQYKIGYYHKDLLFVVDNYKENIANKDKKAAFVNLIQNIADKHPRKVMGKNIQVRGFTLCSGEEFPTGDASTIRKIHTTRLDTPIKGAEAGLKHVIWEEMTHQEQQDVLQLKRCFEMKQYYSGVMLKYISWLLQQHGTELREYLKSEYNTIYFKLSDGVLSINAIGYKLFLEFMQSNGVMSAEEVKESFETHLKVLQEVAVEKKENIQEETTGERFLRAFRTMVKSGDGRIQNDPEYDDERRKYKPRIAISKNEGAEIGINFDESYPVIWQYLHNFFDLPRDGDSVLRQLKEMIKDGRLSGQKSYPVHDPNIGKKKKMLVLDRKSIFADSDISDSTENKVLSIKEIMLRMNSTGVTAYINNLKEKPDYIKHVDIQHMLLDEYVSKIKDEKVVLACWNNAEQALIMFYATKGWDFAVDYGNK